MGGTPDERVAAVAALTEMAWKLAGRPFPSYTRATMPVVITTLAAHSASIAKSVSGDPRHAEGRKGVRANDEELDVH
jgi:anti-sigma-K factor RskA